MAGFNFLLCISAVFVCLFACGMFLSAVFDDVSTTAQSLSGPTGTVMISVCISDWTNV